MRASFEVGNGFVYFPVDCRCCWFEQEIPLSSLGLFFLSMLFPLDDIWTKVPIALRAVESAMEMTREDGSPGQAHTHAYMDMLGLCARERRSELDGMVGGGRWEAGGGGIISCTQKYNQGARVADGRGGSIMSGG